jgi:hypothetical protein
MRFVSAALAIAAVGCQAISGLSGFKALGGSGGATSSGPSSSSTTTSTGSGPFGEVGRRIAAGADFACAIRPQQALTRCWGNNDQGQAAYPPSPPDVVVPPTTVGFSPTEPLLGANVLSAGRDFACMIDSGGLHCWGNNALGVMGPMGAGMPLGPQLVEKAGVKDVALGFANACMIVGEGKAGCRGSDDYAQNGHFGGPSSPGQLNFPLSSNAPPAARVLAGGSFACIFSQGMPTNQGACFGANDTYQLGTNAQMGPIVLMTMIPPGKIVDVAGGGFDTVGHSCMVIEQGTERSVWCWGSGQGSGENGTDMDQPQPVRVQFPMGAPSPVQVTCGHRHSCSLDANGGVWCWGSNTVGQLGDGSFMDHVAPKQVTFEGTFFATSVSAGRAFTCAMDGEGAVQCWGDNDKRQLGYDPRHTPSENPHYVADLDP